MKLCVETKKKKKPTVCPGVPQTLLIEKHRSGGRTAEAARGGVSLFACVCGLVSAWDAKHESDTHASHQRRKIELFILLTVAPVSGGLISHVQPTSLLEERHAW